MATIVLYGITLDTADYTNTIVTDVSGLALSTGTWQWSISGTIVPDLGMDISVYLKNISNQNQLAPQEYVVPLGIKTDSAPKSNYHFWAADFEVTRYSQTSGNTESGVWGPQHNRTYPSDKLAVPFLSVDNGTGLVTFASNYNYPASLWTAYSAIPLNSGTYQIRFTANKSSHISGGVIYRAPTDFFASGEERSFNFWIRIASGVSEAKWLETIEPYKNWYQSQFIVDHSPQINGRIYGVSLSQFEQLQHCSITGDNPRRYWSFVPSTTNLKGGADTFVAPYIHPSSYDLNNGSGVQSTDWNILLSGILPINTLKENGFKAVMLWAAHGHVNDNEDYRPDVINKLPANLYNTLHQIPVWEAVNNFKVMFWVGRAIQTYQSGTWDTIPLSTLSSGYTTYILSSGFNKNILQKPRINAYGSGQIYHNLSSGVFSYADGAGLDAGPRIVGDSWASGWYQSYRRDFPSKKFALENRADDVTSAFVNMIHYPYNQFRGRCIFLDTIMTNYEPWVIVNYPVDFPGNPTAYNTFVRLIENNGGVLITNGGLDAIPNFAYVSDEFTDNILGRMWPESMWPNNQWVVSPDMWPIPLNASGFQFPSVIFRGLDLRGTLLSSQNVSDVMGLGPNLASVCIIAGN